MVSTAESMSPRFARLCERLKAPSTVALGHLALWRERWAGSNELDHGIFWKRSLGDMDDWAQWTGKADFGGALLHAGYLIAAGDLWPRGLRQGCGGWVATADQEGLIMLDTTWRALHGRGPLAARLCWFLSLPSQRWEAVAQNVSAAEVNRLREDGKIPEDWAEAALAAIEARGHSRAGMCAGAHAGAPAGAPAGALARRGRHDDMNISTSCSFLPPPSPPIGPPPSASLLSNDERLPPAMLSSPSATYGNGTEQKGTEQNGNEQRSGNPKTYSMLDQLRHLKNTGGCLRALLLLDDTRRSTEIWKVVAQNHPERVLQLIAEMTESDETWARIRNPAALAMSKLRPLIKPGNGR